MELIQIQANELDSLLYNSVSQLNESTGLTKKLFELLYNTGLRVNEAFNVNLWYEFDNKHFRLIASKGSAERIISKELVPVELHNYYLNKVEIRDSSISMLNYDFKRYIPSFYFGTSQVKHWQHSFRYNYIKRMSDIYRSPRLLQSHVGHIKLESTLHYLNSTIYVDDYALLNTIIGN
jgi:integrase